VGKVCTFRAAAAFKLTHRKFAVEHLQLFGDIFLCKFTPEHIISFVHNLRRGYFCYNGTVDIKIYQLVRCKNIFGFLQNFAAVRNKLRAYRNMENFVHSFPYICKNPLD